MKEKLYKIKDLQPETNLGDCYLNGQSIISLWNKGLWVRKKEGSNEILPIFFKDINKLMEMKVSLTPKDKN